MHFHISCMFTATSGNTMVLHRLKPTKFPGVPRERATATILGEDCCGGLDEECQLVLMLVNLHSSTLLSTPLLSTPLLLSTLLRSCTRFSSPLPSSFLNFSALMSSSPLSALLSSPLLYFYFQSSSPFQLSAFHCPRPSSLLSLLFALHSYPFILLCLLSLRSPLSSLSSLSSLLSPSSLSSLSPLSLLSVSSLLSLHTLLSVHPST